MSPAHDSRFRQPLLLSYGGTSPRLSTTSWVAPNASLIGAVELADEVSVWFGAVLRADGSPITIGEGSNIQDGCVLHTDAGMPLSIDANVSVGHNAVLHGCAIEQGVLVGMNATVLNGARIGAGSLVAAGAVILEGTQIPPRSLVAGVPAKVRRETTDAELASIMDNAKGYRERARLYAVT